MDYQQIYNNIINKARNRILEGYKEKHHIIPKCLGGSNNKDNITELTAREHFLCHQLLCEIFPNEGKLKIALWLMARAKKKYIVNGRTYERLKLEFIKVQTGKTHDISTINKMKDWWSLNKKSRPKEVINKIKETKKKNPSIMTEERIQSHINGSTLKKPIVQFNLNKEKIKEFPSINEASRQTRIRHDCISSCVREKQKTAGGYIWKYKI